MTQRSYPQILDETMGSVLNWIRQVTQIRDDDISATDEQDRTIQEGDAASVVLTTDVSGILPVTNGGTARASHTAYAVICGGTTATGAQQSVASVGTSGQPLLSGGAGALPAFGPLVPVAGTTIQTVFATPYTSNTNITETIPSDDTIPQQSTEGTKILEVTITPKYADSIIELFFEGIGAASAGVLMTSSLFIDSTEDALQVSTAVAGSVNLPAHMTLHHHGTSGNTTARTYKLHVATDTGGTMRMNGTTAARFYGGKCSANLLAREIKV